MRLTLRNGSRAYKIFHLHEVNEWLCDGGGRDSIFSRNRSSCITIAKSKKRFYFSTDDNITVEIFFIGGNYNVLLNRKIIKDKDNEINNNTNNIPVAVMHNKL